MYSGLGLDLDHFSWIPHLRAAGHTTRAAGLRSARVQSDDMPVLTCHARFTCVGLLQTPRLRVDYHTRQLEPKKPGGRGATIDDWLWLEYGDRVNVLVQVRAGGRWPPCTGRGEVAPLLLMIWF